MAIPFEQNSGIEKLDLLDYIIPRWRPILSPETSEMLLNAIRATYEEFPYTLTNTIVPLDDSPNLAGYRAKILETSFNSFQEINKIVKSANGTDSVAYSTRGLSNVGIFIRLVPRFENAFDPYLMFGDVNEIKGVIVIDSPDPNGCCTGIPGVIDLTMCAPIPTPSPITTSPLTFYTEERWFTLFKAATHPDIKVYQWLAEGILVIYAAPFRTVPFTYDIHGIVDALMKEDAHIQAMWHDFTIALIDDLSEHRRVNNQGILPVMCFSDIVNDYLQDHTGISLTQSNLTLYDMYYSGPEFVHEVSRMFEDFVHDVRVYSNYTMTP